MLNRDEPLGLRRAHIHQVLISALVRLGRLGEAEGLMQALRDMDAADDTKRDSAIRLANAYWRQGQDAASARKWAQYVLDEHPGTGAATMAESLMQKVGK